MKKTYLGIGIGIGLILGIGTYLITTAEPTACECYDLKQGISGIARNSEAEKRFGEYAKKTAYECKHKYYGNENFHEEARKECYGD